MGEEGQGKRGGEKAKVEKGRPPGKRQKRNMARPVGKKGNSKSGPIDDREKKKGRGSTWR